MSNIRSSLSCHSFSDALNGTASDISSFSINRPNPLPLHARDDDNLHLSLSSRHPPLFALSASPPFSFPFSFPFPPPSPFPSSLIRTSLPQPRSILHKLNHTLSRTHHQIHQDYSPHPLQQHPFQIKILHPLHMHEPRTWKRLTNSHCYACPLLAAPRQASSLHTLENSMLLCCRASEGYPLKSPPH